MRVLDMRIPKHLGENVLRIATTTLLRILLWTDSVWWSTSALRHWCGCCVCVSRMEQLSISILGKLIQFCRMKLNSVVLWKRREIFTITASPHSPRFLWCQLSSSCVLSAGLLMLVSFVSNSSTACFVLFPGTISSGIAVPGIRRSVDWSACTRVYPGDSCSDTLFGAFVCWMMKRSKVVGVCDCGRPRSVWEKAPAWTYCGKYWEERQCMRRGVWAKGCKV